ncbi:rust resistance kinase Lr10-like isoform X2 [Mangifera indica]|nr:rust resistance kinase Lr10-like isoform X2 [Mangifera indica]
MELLESGFELHWSVECRNCVDAGSFCFLNLETLTCPVSTQFYLTQNLYFVVASSLFDLAVVLYLIARFLIAPLVLFAFLIHKCKSTRKTVDNVEKFLHKQQSWMPKRYSYSELMAVTNNCRDKLGQGGFGSVYKGQLHTGSLIAVKLLENTKFSGEEFINEVSTIGRIHHVNVVQLVGFCSEGSKRALVYEFMPNGSLDRYIFLKESKVQAFSWEKLHEIASGIARGIEYLHGGCDVCILHFDIKPHNILLDEFFIPKVSDFGLAKFYPKENDFVSVSTTRGTIGYIAPELISRNFGAVSSKSDVYSFGMLLLEMVGGRRNSMMKATHSSRAYFPSWVYDRIIKGEDLELPNVSEIEHLMAKRLCIIGLWCIQVRPADRPSMAKVMEMLEGNIDNLQMPPKPFFSSSSSHHNTGGETQCDHSSTELLDLDSDSIVEEYSCYDSNV